MPVLVFIAFFVFYWTFCVSVAAAGLHCAPAISQDITNAGALHLKRVCLDQQDLISYDPFYAPDASNQQLPLFSTEGIFYNWPSKQGNGDKYKRGHNIPASPVVIRAATHLEACPDLREPSFSNCTVPLILYIRWPFNVGELFESAFAQLLPMREAGTISRRMTLVIATPHGLQLPVFARMLFQTLFDPAITTLADFSTRTHLVIQAATRLPLSANLKKHHSSQLITNMYRQALPTTLDQSSVTTSPGPHNFNVSFQHRISEVKGLGRGHLMSVQNHSATLSESRMHSTHSGRLLRQDTTTSTSDIPAWMQSASTVEGVRLRCFENVALFKVTSRKDDELCHCGAHVVAYYRDHKLLPSMEHLFKESGPTTLRVVFASQPHAHAHLLLNEAELVAKCNSLLSQGTGRYQHSRSQLSSDPQPSHNVSDTGLLKQNTQGVAPSTGHTHGGEEGVGPGRWVTIQCIQHEFGRDAMQDLRLASTSDVLVCVHGAVCYNAFFMKEGASLIEVRPFDFPVSWSIKYYPTMLDYETKVFWFAIDIKNISNSVSSDMEATKSELLRAESAPRDRHVNVPWPALETHLRSVLKCGGSKPQYWDIYKKGEQYITDDLQVLGLLHTVRLRSVRHGWLGWNSSREL